MHLKIGLSPSRTFREQDMPNTIKNPVYKALELQRLEFPIGWGETGAVFLRVRIYEDGTLSFFCTSADESGKTNVTNAMERIFEAAVRTLATQELIPNPVLDSGSIPLKDLASIAKQSVWVQYIRPEDSISGTESYALVGVDAHFNPFWCYLSKAELAKQPGLDIKFLTPPERCEDTAPDLYARAVSQLDEIFFALKNAETLLEQGRSLGIQFGMSERARTLIEARHGQDAVTVLRNCAHLG